ncbi:MAG: NBR1-Ig-like domain-containing protein [Anaerolineae bacterium]
MDFERVEQAYHRLRTRRDRGNLDDDQFRVEVAKLLLHDAEGHFWMIDPETGAWFCNEGEGWHEEDPRAHLEGSGYEVVPDTHPRSHRRLWLLVTLLVALIAVALTIVILKWPAGLWEDIRSTTIPTPSVEVSIAFPADGSVVTVGQEVGIELMLRAEDGLQPVANAVLQVGDDLVETWEVSSRVQPDQTNLPLSLPWRPSAAGEYEISISALSETGEPLASASIKLLIVEAADELPPEPACVLDATFLNHVTIPPDTEFPPGAQMAKIWQVHNSGTCAWDTGFELAHVGGDLLGAVSPARVPATAAGERANLEVVFVAPEEEGTHNSIWQLRSSDEKLFGPQLELIANVQAQAEPGVPPAKPAGLQATITEDGRAVRLTWEDLSDNEEAFRIYREDVEASIGLVPADAEVFEDRSVACGTAYHYSIAAFNGSGTSSLVESPEVVLPACAAHDQRPTLTLTAVPTQVVASDTFTVIFQAVDDIGLRQVVVQGESTGDAELDAGRTFPCAAMRCAGSWSITWNQETTATLVLTAVARDSGGQDSEPARTTVVIVNPEQPTSGRRTWPRAKVWSPSSPS